LKVRFAVAPGLRSFDADDLDALLDACERLRFDTLWLSDVPLGQIGDPLVSLNYAAARTSRLKLGANVVPLGRNPMLLARELAQLDLLSRGRLLLSFVPGLNWPGEAEALGVRPGGPGRTGVLDEVIPLLRRWWAGERVTYRSDRFAFTDIEVVPRPQQVPLEIWLGGHGPEAMRRTGRLADGWLTAAMSPEEAGGGRTVIEAAAREVGRTIDDEHFGISMPYARHDPPASVVEGIRLRRAEVAIDDVLAVGKDALRTLVQRHIDQGLSKFVLRPVTPMPSVEEELEWLADAVLSLQT
jgi:probable F420-dependent oxidoreductase